MWQELQVSMDLRCHVQRKHSGTSYPLHPCQRSFSSHRASEVPPDDTNGREILCLHRTLREEIHSGRWVEVPQEDTGEKPHTCDQGEKHFSKRISLQSHQLTQTGEKSVSCDECGKRFHTREPWLHTREFTPERKLTTALYPRERLYHLK